MGLPRPEQVRREMSEMARVYALVVAIVVVGVLMLQLGGATSGFVTPALEVVGPF